MFNDKTILITGGTGFFGENFVKFALENLKPKKLIVYSRDEHKQARMSLLYKNHTNLRFFIGDVRDKERLRLAFNGVDYVIHAAALKHVPIAEYNPFEAIQTNVIGAQNIIYAALDAGVKKVVSISTDKACNPINLYGATKLCAEKLFISANAYAGSSITRFSVVRYGNVLGSRGSVVPLFIEMAKKNNEITITDPRMTRFWITIKQAIDLVVNCLIHMQGGELFIPKLPSIKIVDLAKVIAPNSNIKIIGIRPGEKLHETLISSDESRYVYETKNLFIKLPEFQFWHVEPPADSTPVSENFEYKSNTNNYWLTIDEIRKVLQEEKWI